MFTVSAIKKQKSKKRNAVITTGYCVSQFQISHATKIDKTAAQKESLYLSVKGV
jgi:hypothetical protein